MMISWTSLSSPKSDNEKLNPASEQERWIQEWNNKEKMHDMQ